MTLWGGRFEGGAGGANPLFQEFNSSISVDHRLAQHDIVGSIAWAKALHAAGVLTADETRSLLKALDELAIAVRRQPETVRTSGAEDVHSWVESKLIEKVGDLGKKLHTGRSRNDQIATDLRLWVREQIAIRLDEVRAVQRALVKLGQREVATVFPGYTHLQPAQPILFAHWCLAYVQMLDRDAERFENAADRTNDCPLGCGALAGTAYPIDRMQLAKSLGFAKACDNSLDAVSDRDFVLETLATASVTSMHLSRMAEDLIMYQSAEFGLISVPDDFTSGSSLMPQKRNPDALELIRGKCARIIGAHTALMVMMKGLPLAYNKDLQEDKLPLFDAMEQVSMCLCVLPPMLDGLKVDRERARAAACSGYANATDLADYLVERGVPFRDAHGRVGSLVRLAIAEKKPLDGLSLDQLRSASPEIGEDVFARLTVESCLQRRNALGGTSPQRIAKALDAAEQHLKQQGNENEA